MVVSVEACEFTSARHVRLSVHIHTSSIIADDGVGGGVLGGGWGGGGVGAGGCVGGESGWRVGQQV